MGELGSDTESGQSPSLTIGTRKDGTSRLDLSSAAFSKSFAAPPAPPGLGSAQDFFWREPSLLGAATGPGGRWGGRAGDRLRDLERSRWGKRLSALVAWTGLEAGK